jgi:hypothetical protein
MRRIQKTKVRNIKLNFVSGLLKRFYSKFLSEFKLVSAGKINFGVVNSQPKKQPKKGNNSNDAKEIRAKLS